MKLTIIIGCFNERRTILQAIQEAKNINLDKEIIVIDNCSTNGTKEILNNLKNDNSLRIIFHSKNMGAGYSGYEGMQLAKGEYCYAPGADLEYRMQDVYKMIEKLEKENLDAVFGSRLLDRKDISKFYLIKERPFWLGTILSTFLINKLYRRSFTDIIAPKLIKTSILKNLGCKAENQAFEFELASRLCKKGYKIKEVPIYYSPRSHKEGKTIRVIDIIPALWAILKIRFLARQE